MSHSFMVIPLIYSGRDQLCIKYVTGSVKRAQGMLAIVHGAVDDFKSVNPLMKDPYQACKFWCANSINDITLTVDLN